MREQIPVKGWPGRENDVRQLSGVDDLEPKFPKAHRAVTNHAAPRNPILCPSPENHMVQNSEEYYYITSEE